MDSLPELIPNSSSEEFNVDDLLNHPVAPDASKEGSDRPWNRPSVSSDLELDDFIQFAEKMQENEVSTVSDEANPTITDLDPANHGQEAGNNSDRSQFCLTNSDEMSDVNSPNPPACSLYSDTKSPDSTVTVQAGRTRKRSASQMSTGSESERSASGKNTKNALAAKENRLKKKRYVEDLEKSKDCFEKENNDLRERNSELLEENTQLVERVEYLTNVLHNESALSDLLGNLGGSSSTVRLSVASQGGRRRKRDGRTKEVISMGKGVCLHVDGESASLTLCSKCAIMAKQTSD